MTDFVLPQGLNACAVVTRAGSQRFNQATQGLSTVNANATITNHSLSTNFEVTLNGQPADTASWGGGLVATVLNGAIADFQADVTAGASPLTVNFIDTSATSDAGGILSWGWDLDGDGIVDSTVQNPTFTYNACGNYTVTLTVLDGVANNDTRVKTDFIDVDPLVAGIGPLPELAGVNSAVTLEWTGTAGAAVTWDLGDGQTAAGTNPVVSWPVAGTYTITATGILACKIETATATIVVDPDRLLLAPEGPSLTLTAFSTRRTSATSTST